MDKISYDILNIINEGIIFLNEELKIMFWNDYMECITGIDKGEVINNNLYEVLPNLNKNYLRESIKNVMNNDYKMFFSAAMHPGVINNKEKLNFKISKIHKDNLKYLLIEFIDVTNQFVRINQLKKYVNKLYILNEELKEKEKVIKKLAYYDALTGVANRTLFYKISEKFFDNARRNNSLLGLMFIDVDNFKIINDTYGHNLGDKVLVQVAKVLTKNVRKSDIIGRFGGDEFLVLLPNIKNHDDYKVIISRIMNAENKIFSYDGKNVDISLSIGASVYPYDGNNIDELILKADKAMYSVKSRGGNDYFINRFKYRDV